MHFDAVVVGTGPGGATSAYHLANSGFKVALVERLGPPRDKTCGGLLTDACDRLVKKIFSESVPDGVLIPPKKMPVAVIPPSGRTAGYYVRDEYVLNVTRRSFDGWLTDRAVKAGVVLYRSAEFLFFQERGGVILSQFREPHIGTVTSDFLIGGDGVYSRVRAQLSPRKDADRAYYIQEYYPRTGEFDDAFYLMYRENVSPIYAYVIPKFDALCLGIGVHRARPPSFREGMTNFKAWLEEDFGFRDLGRIGKEGFSVPFGGLFGGRGRILLVGDAAGFCYPITGEGITFAIQSGAEAAVAIGSGADSDAAERYWMGMKGLANTMQIIADTTLTMTDEERERRAGRKYSGLPLPRRKELRASSKNT